MRVLATGAVDIMVRAGQRQVETNGLEGASCAKGSQGYTCKLLQDWCKRWSFGQHHHWRGAAGEGASR